LRKVNGTPFLSFLAKNESVNGTIQQTVAIRSGKGIHATIDIFVVVKSAVIIARTV